ncbi:hypothetical protein [Gelidibacter maritimus]|uniref:Lipocalin-like domain-containing protein n=1 Tax=Gelidibacter maritimus TaxID=2761487 RepID=A0A7W2M6Y3_9FLAO|nr:hypothetical protein [Gelidibacter maritimus]MBA6153815.1 hypothetical protein [Gelidibacter maritimus]
MKPLLKAFLFLFIIVNIGCDNDNESLKIDESNMLIGYWINPVYTDPVTTFERANRFKDAAYGVAFLTENISVERSSGWCGTPPLVFADFQGKWKKNDSIITISNDNGMAGLMDNHWKIRTLNETHLVIERLP